MKKAKFLLAVVIMLLAALTLSSCGGGGSSVTVYSPDTIVSIVRSENESTEAQMSGYLDIVDAIREKIGANCQSMTDVFYQKNFEIVVGESNREVTRLAKEFLESNAILDGDTESYVFFYKNNSIAIVASSDFAMEVAVEAFIQRYVTTDTLTIKSNMVDFKQFSKAAYLAEQDAKITAAEQERWEHRWDAVRDIVGQEGLEAIQRLYNWWRPENAHETNGDWLDWTIGLYDPETGGFYYAASARDYYGFGPDIESTAQIFNLYDEFGLFSWYEGESWIEAVPTEMRAKLGAWVQGMQSDVDGYFYHDQWGEGIGTSAKGRHLSQAIYLLWVAGVDPLHKSPLDTSDTAMSGTSDVISAFMDTEEHKSSVVFTNSTLPDYMQSVDAVLQYLDEQWEDHYDESSGQNSYGFGHLLSSQANQFKAAGDDIINAVCDWLDEHQREDNGFWEPILEEKPDTAYRAISGLIKISSVYGNAGRPFGRTDKMVDAAIDIMLSNVEPAHVCYIYNPVGAFDSILSSMRKVPGLEDAIVEAKQKFFYKLPEIVDAVIEKQQVFRKELGSFSYVPTRSDPNSQGLRISLGFPEGDVNATAVSMHYVSDGLFGVLGTPIVPMFRYSDFKYFSEQIAGAGTAIKKDLVLEVLNFDEGDIDTRITYPQAPDYSVEVVDDGRDGDDAGQALEISTGGSASRILTVEMKTALVPTCTSVELDMNFISSANQGYLYSLYIQSRESTRTGYELQFYATADGSIKISECSNDPDSTKNYVHDLAILPMGEWFNLRIEYYPESKEDLHVKVYVNDECIYVSEKTYYCSYSPWVVYNGMNLLNFSCFGGNQTTVMLDNIECKQDPAKTYDGSDYNPGGNGAE